VDFVRLNRNQLRFRRDQALSALGNVVADQVWDILKEIGVIERLLAAGMFGGSQPVEQPRLSEYELAEQALRRALESNDIQAVELVEKRRVQQESVQAFNVEFHVTPYRIADPSLERIVLEADGPVVIRIVEAVLERSRTDGCPDDVVGQLRNAMWRWNEWAVGGLRARLGAEDEQVTADTG
jgi:hypothetical protein